MLKVDKKGYEKVIIRIITSNDMREVLREFSLYRVFFYSLLKDVTRGKESPNYRLLQEIAWDRKISEDFIVDQAKLILSHLEPDETKEDHYQVLNISVDSSAEEIRKSWINLMKAHHPDHVGDLGLDRAKRLNEAYEVLGDPVKRRRYDARRVPALPIVVKSSYGDLITHEFIFLVMLGAAILVSGFYLIRSGQFLRTAQKISYSIVNGEETPELIDGKTKLPQSEQKEDLISALPDEGAEEAIAKSLKIERATENVMVSQGKLDVEQEYPKDDEQLIAGAAVEELDSESTVSRKQKTLTQARLSEETPKDKTPLPKDSTKKSAVPGQMAEAPDISSQDIPERKEERKGKLSEATIPSSPETLPEEIKGEGSVPQRDATIASLKEESTPEDERAIKVAVVKKPQDELGAKYSIQERNLPSPPSHQSLYLFVSEYVSSYKNRDLRRFMALFATDAQENGVRVSKALNSYRKNFSSLEILRYDVRLRKLDFADERASVNGDFFVAFREENAEDLKASSGTISWLLSWNGDDWKIREINYEVRKTGLASSWP